jgi:putative salt-induced outer membrane protein YdiY
MNRSTYISVLALVGSLFGMSATLADEIRLDDGSRLIGTVTGIGAETLTLDTEFAGTIEIQRSRISGIFTDAPVRVVLDSGERVVGRLVVEDSGVQAMVSDTAGRFALARESITAVEDPASPVAEQLPSAAWTSDVSVAVSGASGNTDQVTSLARFSALRDSDGERLQLGLQGRFGRQDGSQTENEVIGSIGLERDFSDRWFMLGGVRLERDELEDLDLRANVDFGVGYFVIREDRHEFKPRVAIGFQYESFEDAGTNEDIVGVLGWDYRYDMNSRWRFAHVLDYRPTFSDPANQFRIDSEASLITMLNDGRWGLRFLLSNRYNNDPAPGIDELDTVYAVGIQRTFK